MKIHLRIHVLLIMLFSGLCSCIPEPSINSSIATTSIEIPQRTYNFGTIDNGIVVKHEFKIKNVGDQPLIINEVSSNCDCTVFKWSKVPVLPQQNARIQVIFNPTAQIEGIISKTLLIRMNTDSGLHKIYFMGNIVSRKNNGNSDF
ncbi:MAG: DUF1573 domain-containing protein [Bacteroidota bacterium]